MYTIDIDKTDKNYLQLIDVIGLFTRAASDIPKLEPNFERLCSLYPKARKILGVYMWDYLGSRGPIPLRLMKHQCDLALKWLKSGRIEGVTFVGSPMCDMDIDAVEWTRRWVQHVGEQRL
jgi:hypothetical protein